MKNQLVQATINSERTVQTIRVNSMTALELLQLLTTTMQFPSPSKLIIWQHNAVLSALLQDGKLIFSIDNGYLPEHIIEIRAFNQHEELHISKNYAGFTCRYINDTRGQEQEYVDSMARIWGEYQLYEQQGFSSFHDQGRRISLLLPCQLNSKYAELLTRSYITYNPITHQAEYSDYRYVDIVKGRQEA